VIGHPKSSRALTFVSPDKGSDGLGAGFLAASSSAMTAPSTRRRMTRSAGLVSPSERKTPSTRRRRRAWLASSSRFPPGRASHLAVSLPLDHGHSWAQTVICFTHIGRAIGRARELGTETGEVGAC